MNKIIHGGDIYTDRGIPPEQLIDFSASLNPLGMPHSVRQALSDIARTRPCYPDPLCRELKYRLSAYESMPVEYFFCGNGAAEIIYRLVSALRPKKAGVLAPTFSEYERALDVAECEVVRFELAEYNDFELTDQILPYITEDMDMLFLCNPNNPTGRITSFELMQQIAERCEQTGCLLVVDECFLDFVEGARSMTQLLWGNKHLVVLKAFTKIFAMAGIRLGYCLCSDSALIARLERAGDPWNVSVPAQQCGIAATKEKEFVQQTREFVRQEREYLSSELRVIGFRVYKSEANYLMFRCDDSKLDSRLLKYGILIRSCADYVGLDEYDYRIGIKTHEHNTALTHALLAIRFGE